MSNETRAGDEHMGQFVYCTQHLRVHSTGWCTVGPRDKIPLKASTLEEARQEAVLIDDAERARWGCTR